MNSGPLRCKSRSRASRRGIATVELAICLPLMVTITFGAIEAASFIYLKQALTEATYECARFATMPGKSSQEAKLRFEEITQARALQDVTLTISPAVTAKTASGTVVTVTATAPAWQNSTSPLLYFRSHTLTSKVVMVRL